MDSALQMSKICGQAVNFAASSAGRDLSFTCLSPRPPMCIPSAACCLLVSVSPVAILVSVMSMVLSASWNAGVSSWPYNLRRCWTLLSPRQWRANLSLTAGSLSVASLWLHGLHDFEAVREV